MLRELDVLAEGPGLVPSTSMVAKIHFSSRFRGSGTLFQPQRTLDMPAVHIHTSREDIHGTHACTHTHTRVSQGYVASVVWYEWEILEFKRTKTFLKDMVHGTGYMSLNLILCTLSSLSNTTPRNPHNFY